MTPGPMLNIDSGKMEKEIPYWVEWVIAFVAVLSVITVIVLLILIKS